MKKIIALVLTTTLALTLFVGCGKSNTTTQVDNSLERVQKAGELTIGLDDSYPPMEYRDDKNNLVGFDIDLGSEIAKKLGVKSKSVPTDWNGIVLALKSAKFDIVLSAMSITPERQQEIDFAGPYVDGGQIIVIKSGSDKIKTSADLKDKVLGCQLGATGEQAAMKIQGTKEVKKYDKITEAFHDLSIGRLDAVIVDGQVGGYYITKEVGAYKILDEKLTKEPEGIGVRKEDQKLKAAIQKALDELKADGTLTKLSMKHFGYDIYK